MPRYAVRVAEVLIVSDEPITDTQRREVIRELQRDPAAVVASGAVELHTVFAAAPLRAG
jgi:hypothetical protein